MQGTTTPSSDIWTVSDGGAARDLQHARALLAVEDLHLLARQLRRLAEVAGVLRDEVERLVREYGDRFVFFGGFDSNGPVAQEGATVEEIQNEVVSCLDAHGKYGRGCCFFGFFMRNATDPAAVGAAMGPMIEKCVSYGFELMMKNAQVA